MTKAEVDSILKDAKEALRMDKKTLSFIPEEKLFRSQFSIADKSKYIREHGVDNYLGLPWDE